LANAICGVSNASAARRSRRATPTRRGATAWEHHKATPLERDDIFIAQANAFLDGMHGQPTPLATIAEAAQTLKFNLAALESARSGKAVEL
jgi:predicted dehydrogenase